MVAAVVGNRVNSRNVCSAEQLRRVISDDIDILIGQRADNQQECIEFGHERDTTDG